MIWLQYWQKLFVPAERGYSKTNTLQALLRVAQTLVKSYAVLHFHSRWDNKPTRHSTQTSLGAKADLTPSDTPSFQLSPQQGPASTDHLESWPPSASSRPPPSVNKSSPSFTRTQTAVHWKHTLLIQFSADSVSQERIYSVLIGLGGLWERPIN